MYADKEEVMDRRVRLVASCMQYARMSIARFVLLRGKALMDIFGSWLGMGLNMVLWFSLYTSQGITSIQGYGLSDLMWYLAAVAITEMIINHPYQAQEQMHDIHEGILNTYLLKGVHPFWVWCIQNMSKKCITAFFFGLPFLIVYFFFSQDVLHTLGTALLWIFFLLLGGMLRFLLFSTVALLTFWIGYAWGWTFILRVCMIAASGAFLPLSFFPQGVKIVLDWLPFQFVGYIPAQALIGRLTGGDIVHALVVGALWCAILLVIWSVVYKRGIRVYEAYGG